MTADEILNSADFKRCEAFHGHVCPGLSMGYRATKLAMERLKENRAEDEELVAIVETDACSADAVQVLTGCTFGKGNFIFRDYGKMALTLFSRKSGDGVRVSLRQGAFTPDEKHMALIQKIMSGQATDAEQDEFRQIHFKRTCDVLEAPADEMFVITEVKTGLPSKARIEPSQPCARCGEPTMPSKMESAGEGKICRGCADL
ncbi:MAG: FmdE family protein [Desulfatirhabdiaceae bacterium]